MWQFKFFGSPWIIPLFPIMPFFHLRGLLNKIFTFGFSMIWLRCLKQWLWTLNSKKIVIKNLHLCVWRGPANVRVRVAEAASWVLQVQSGCGKCWACTTFGRQVCRIDGDNRNCVRVRVCGGANEAVIAVCAKERTCTQQLGEYVAK